MKKIAIITILALAIVMFVAAPFAQAEEINPTPGTYSYGSTSEFSPYAGFGNNPGPTPTPTPQPTPGTLAPTGQNVWLLYILALIAITAPLAYIGVKRFKAKEK